MIAQQVQPFVNTRDGEPLQFLNLPTLIRATGDATGGAFGLVEQWNIPPGFASPYHTHHREDEAFYVLDGEMAFVCGGQWMTAGAGAFVFGPRGIAHGFKVQGATPARMLLLCAPGGFERFVLEMSEPSGTPASPPDLSKLVVVAQQYGIEIHGPLPE
jgi:quercetin dioxygenase-like cupin family protein